MPFYFPPVIAILDIAKQSTQYTGRIWTDKSVFTDGVTLPGSGEEVGGGNIAVKQGDSDFLVGFLRFLLPPI